MSHEAVPGWLVALARPAAALLVFLSVAAWPAGPAPGVQSLAGKLLVAAPEMRDPNFAETVVYMVQHDDTGAMGLVINRVVGEGPLSDLLRSLGLPTEGVKGDIRIHYGGPVGLKQGFILHSPDYTSESSIQVNGDFTLSSDPAVLVDIGHGRGPRQSLFAFGYAGWAPGQLEGEIAQEAWTVLSTEPDFVFNGDVRSKWKQAIARREIEL